jgi:hypothetical protein
VCMVIKFVQPADVQPYTAPVVGTTKLAQSFIAGKSPTVPVYLQVGAVVR